MAVPGVRRVEWFGVPLHAIVLDEGIILVLVRAARTVGDGAGFLVALHQESPRHLPVKRAPTHPEQIPTLYREHTELYSVNSDELTGGSKESKAKCDF